MKAKKVILIAGLPGTGKSYLAAALADRILFRRLNSDTVRANINKRGNYDEAAKNRVYHEMLEELNACLNRGEDVIVDATFYRRSVRRQFMKAVEEKGGECCLINLTAGEDVIRKRVERWRADSEADFEAYMKVKAAYEPIDEPHLVLDSGNLTTDEMITRIFKYCRLPYE